jgi:putative transposase
MKCIFIEEHRKQWPIRLMCDVLGISTAAFYVARARPVSARQQRRDVLHQKIVTIHQQVKARYGSPRIHAELLDQGETCCVNTVAAVMKEHGIAAKRRRSIVARQTRTIRTQSRRTCWSGSLTRWRSIEFGVPI